MEINNPLSATVPRIFSTKKSDCISKNSVKPSLLPKLIFYESSWSMIGRNRSKKVKAAITSVSQQTVPAQPRSSGHKPNHKPDKTKPLNLK
ncbi:putative eka-like protein [Golovinomyces cichoracearum]|uniref:Putative eka-like protein n=1 Tax=Golovinomyces cichoracearum TaxID=62708 RepID=A0A420IMM2_9PEZI|nr:putative eka-like protein [Golovinomyces cichoracearum]